MRILLIGPGKIKYMPYVHFYLQSIDLFKHEVHLAYWNRDEKPEDISSYSNIILQEFKDYMLNDVSIKTKFKHFYKYRLFIKQLLCKYNYDFIIVLHSLSGLIILDILGTKYKNRYLLDYRDSTYETNNIFKYFVGRLVKWSRLTFVSSDAFRKYLPIKYLNKIYTSHNLLEDSLLHRDDAEKYHIFSNKIRIAFWGFIRHVEINKILIDKISSDSRFELHYYGREQKEALELKQYINENNINNVYFHGEYIPNDRYQFIRSTDIIHNVYLDTNMLLAMANKYYDSIIFRIPMLSMPESYMGERSSKLKVGFALDPRSKTFTDDLYSLYMQQDKDTYFSACDKELEHVLNEYYLGKKILSSLFEN